MKNQHLATIKHQYNQAYKWGIYRKICTALAKGIMSPAHNHLTWLFTQEENRTYVDMRRVNK